MCRFSSVCEEVSVSVGEEMYQLRGGGAHSSLDHDCPKFEKHVEISRVMAYDNLPFLETRRLVETNGSLPSPTVKSLRNFPTLPSRSPDVLDAHPPSGNARISDLQSFKEVLQGELKNDLRLPLQSILEAIMTAKVLCDRIKKTIDLHISIDNSKEKK